MGMGITCIHNGVFLFVFAFFFCFWMGMGLMEFSIFGRDGMGREELA